MKDGVNALENALFEELRNLQAVDMTDREAVQAAVAHSKAVEGLAQAITDNHNVALDAARLMARPQSDVKLPKLLEGDE